MSNTCGENLFHCWWWWRHTWNLLCVDHFFLTVICYNIIENYVSQHGPEEKLCWQKQLIQRQQLTCCYSVFNIRYNKSLHKVEPVSFHLMVWMNCVEIEVSFLFRDSQFWYLQIFGQNIISMKLLLTIRLLILPKVCEPKTLRYQVITRCSVSFLHLSSLPAQF